MSTLLVQTLDTELSQEIRFNLSNRVNIGAFIPYLYMHNSPAGTFIFELLNESDEIIMSQEFDCNDIKLSLGTSDNYAHVFYPIIPTNPIQIEYGLYTIKLSATGYSPSGSSFLGWIQQFENIQNVMDYVPLNSANNSLAVRIKEYV